MEEVFNLRIFASLLLDNLGLSLHQLLASYSSGKFLQSQKIPGVGRHVRESLSRNSADLIKIYNFG